MLSAANFKVNRAKGKTAKLKLALGQTEWLAVNQQEQMENLGSAPVEMLRFDFKTAPLSKGELEKKRPHVHPKN
jgi:hypothetical protein